MVFFICKNNWKNKKVKPLIAQRLYFFYGFFEADAEMQSQHNLFNFFYLFSFLFLLTNTPHKGGKGGCNKKSKATILVQDFLFIVIFIVFQRLFSFLLFCGSLKPMFSRRLNTTFQLFFIHSTYYKEQILNQQALFNPSRRWPQATL